MKTSSLLVVLMIFAFVTNESFGQNNTQEQKSPIINFRDKPSVFLMYDRNFSFVDSKLASTTGFIAGLQYSNRLKLGLGYSWLVSDVVEEKIVVTEAGRDSSLNAKLSMRTGVVYGEYILYNKGNWEFSTPLQMAIGSSYFTYYEDVGDQIKEKKLNQQGVWIVSTTGMATYRFLRWFGVSAGAGLRVVLVDNKSLDHNLNGPVFTFKVRVFFGEIYKSVFPNGIGKGSN